MSLWAAEFDTSLLMTHDVVIYCPSESLADELMVLLEEHGVQWSGNKPPTSNKHWGEYEYQCYYISSRGSMLYGPPDSTDDDEWRYYIKCTFYGSQDDEFEVADDESLLSFLGIK